MPKRIRTFLAIGLPGAVKKHLAALEEQLAEHMTAVKWIEPENLHLTLKFLGDVENHELYSVCKTAQQAVADLAAFEAAVAGIGAFPTSARPRTIWAGLREGAAELGAVHEALERAFAEQGYAREDRAHTPHITLGRARRAGFAEDISALIESHKTFHAGRVPVTEVLIFSSQLGPDGPEYTVMGRAALAS